VTAFLGPATPCDFSPRWPSIFSQLFLLCRPPCRKKVRGKLDFSAEKVFFSFSSIFPFPFPKTCLIQNTILILLKTTNQLGRGKRNVGMCHDPCRERKKRINQIGPAEVVEGRAPRHP
jgi:hypothetical protein